MSGIGRLAALVAAATLLATTATAQERTLRLASGVPPAHPATDTMYANFLRYLPEETDGRLGGLLLGPEVASLGQMKDALQSQIVEVGNFLPLYHPAELPYFGLAGELSLLPSNPHAAAAAMNEFIVTCAPCQSEMRDFGLVYVGSISSDVYEILSTRPVRGLADLKGARLRSGGAPWARFAEHFGAIPAQITANDTFESISQGVIDGSMASSGDLISFRLIELVKYVTVLPMGLYQANSTFTVASSTWTSLTPEDRAALARAANRANADMTQRWGYSMSDESLAAATDAGIEVIEADPEMVAAIEEFTRTEAGTVARLAATNFGLTDAEVHITRYLDLLRKWEAIASELGNDPSAMAARLQNEVWDKVDFATYGL